MNKESLHTLLQGNAYPGRGIVIGINAAGTHAVIAYFIMGRSENSRNRVFVAKGEALITEAFDAAKVEDPSLIIYSPVKVVGDTTIVTNGDQTDTIEACLKRGGTMRKALRTRTFEPDAPNYTPRISGVLRAAEGRGAYTLSIVKSRGGNANSVQRFFYEYAQPLAGEGHFIHTYQGDGNPLPSFAGEPRTVDIAGTIDEFTHSLWASMNAENKISLFTRFVDLSTGATESRIINKNEK